MAPFHLPVQGKFNAFRQTYDYTTKYTFIYISYNKYLIIILK